MVILVVIKWFTFDYSLQVPEKHAPVENSQTGSRKFQKVNSRDYDEDLEEALQGHYQAKHTNMWTLWWSYTGML